MIQSKLLAGLAAVMVAIVGVAGVKAQVVPGYIVEQYAENVPLPVELGFDPSGVLYAGFGDSDIPGSISRIGIGGFPVGPYGPPLSDPDAVLVDTAGLFAMPGSVLVGTSNVGVGGIIHAILPDETLIDVIGPTLDMQNPNRMVFDNNNRLVIGADDIVGEVYVSTGPGDLTPLITLPAAGASLVVDDLNQIYVRTVEGIIRIYDENGVLVNDNFAPTGLDGIGPMAFGPGNILWGDDLYTLNKTSGELLRIDSAGDVSVIGTGFPSGSTGTVDLTFGPDGFMYLSLLDDNGIIRVVPEPNALALLALGGMLFVRRR